MKEKLDNTKWNQENGAQKNENINKEIETIMKEPEEVVELKYTISGKIHYRHSTTNLTK